MIIPSVKKQTMEKSYTSILNTVNALKEDFEKQYFHGNHAAGKRLRRKLRNIESEISFLKKQSINLSKRLRENPNG